MQKKIYLILFAILYSCSSEKEAKTLDTMGIVPDTVFVRDTLQGKI